MNSKIVAHCSLITRVNKRLNDAIYKEVFLSGRKLNELRNKC